MSLEEKMWAGRGGVVAPSWLLPGVDAEKLGGDQTSAAKICDGRGHAFTYQVSGSRHNLPPSHQTRLCLPSVASTPPTAPPSSNDTQSPSASLASTIILCITPSIQATLSIDKEIQTTSWVHSLSGRSPSGGFVVVPLASLILFLSSVTRRPAQRRPPASPLLEENS